jgi:hypothetical protein
MGHGKKIETSIIAACEAVSMVPSPIWLEVSIAAQVLHLWEGNLRKGSWPISTSKRPPSEIENSFGTPRGLHAIVEKIGDGCPLGMVFKGRQPIGKVYSEIPDQADHSLITTRILRLSGCEPGRNRGGDRDTFRRYVYIHGTNQEQKIGQPASAGCIHLRNQEVIDLFDQVPVGTLVLIRD